MPHILRFAWLALALGACGSELGRVPFADAGTNETTLQLEAAQLSFWTDINIEYEGPAALTYRIEVLQNGQSVATASCNALERMSVRTGWVETNFGDTHTRRGQGKMDCSAKLPLGGPTTVRATLAFEKSPRQAKLLKADLVVKQ